VLNRRGPSGEMVNFPIFQRLDISSYGLYPGSPDAAEPGLHIEFRSGLTLILGANGLGKSTLISIMYRLLTGPFDIPGIVGRTDLGTMKLAATPLARSDRTTFAQRVVDGAR
jgi:energy-coupling factor transporter ATP-binding protein EcfA2